jgi:hypothetical protein
LGWHGGAGAVVGVEVVVMVVVGVPRPEPQLGWQGSGVVVVDGVETVGA